MYSGGGFPIGESSSLVDNKGLIGDSLIFVWWVNKFSKTLEYVSSASVGENVFSTVVLPDPGIVVIVPSSLTLNLFPASSCTMPSAL